MTEENTFTSGTARNFLQTGSLANSVASADRVEQLRRDFAAIDASGDGLITFEELRAFLLKRSSKRFDEELLVELFSRMDADRDAQISLDEFVSTYIEAENIIKGRIEQLKRQIATSKTELEKNRRQVLEAETNERLNEYGVMEDSVVTIKVIDAQDFIPPNASSVNPVAKVTFDKQSISTSVRKGDMHPIWEESFTFKVTKDTGEVTVELQNDQLFGNSFLGQVKLPLGMLRDQLKHRDNFQLRGKKGEPAAGVIRLEVQWIWSTVRYLKDVGRKWEENIELDTREIEQLNEQLNKLQSPFGIVIGNYNLEVLQTEAIKEVENVISIKVESLADVIYEQLLEPAGMKWEQITEIAVYVLMFIGCLICFARSDFVTLTIIMAAGIQVLTDNEELKVYKLLAICLLGSLIYDLIWFGLWGHSYGHGEVIADGLGNSVRRFSLVMSILNLLVKLLACMIFWKRGLISQGKQVIFLHNMEHDPDLLADEARKLREIDAIVSVWHLKNCDSLADQGNQQRCKKVQDLTFEFVERMENFKEKMWSCQQIIEESALEDRNQQFDACLNETEFMLVKFIGSIHERMVNASKGIFNN